MTTPSGRIRLLDPTVGPVVAQAHMAARPADLRGLRLGLLANGKRTADTILNALGDLLRAHGVREVAFANKRDYARPAPPEVLDDLAKRCDVLVTGVGD
jgi:hypothetical protein